MPELLEQNCGVKTKALNHKNLLKHDNVSIFLEK